MLRLIVSLIQKQTMRVYILFHKVSNPNVSLILVTSWLAGAWTHRHPDPYRRNYGQAVPWKRIIGKAQAR